MARILLLGLALVSCGRAEREVVVYASVDELYARPLFEAFSRETGIAVRAVHDVEEAKTLGLVHRLLAERRRPRADVFWNGEAARSVLLAEQNCFEPFRPESAADLPARFRDPSDRWTGFAARARVIVLNRERVKEPPRSLEDLAAPRWKGRVAIAHPSFGTTATHLAALRLAWGEDRVLAWLEALRANGVRVVGGNSHVRDLVARGECDLGLTDSDDVAVGEARGDAIASAIPREGTLLIPNSAALVRGAPNPPEARRFLEWLLSRSTEAALAAGPSKQIPLRGAAPAVKALDVDWSRMSPAEDFLDRARKALDL